MTSTRELDDLLADHSDAVAGTARELRNVILDGHPGLSERVQQGWHSVNYTDPAAGFVCVIVPLADRVRLGYVFGAHLPDPEGRLIGTGRQIRYLEFTDAGDVDPAVVLEFLDLTVDLRLAFRSRRR